MENHRGERVIVRAFNGGLLIRRVWAAYPWAVEVTGDEQFEAHERGEVAPMPIPFPREDVFVADPDAVRALTSGDALKSSRLRLLPP
jgi:hypothetical protein